MNEEEFTSSKSRGRMVCIRDASIAELIAAIEIRVKQRPNVVEVEFSICLRRKTNVGKISTVLITRTSASGHPGGRHNCNAGTGSFRGERRASAAGQAVRWDIQAVKNRREYIMKSCRDLFSLISLPSFLVVGHTSPSLGTNLRGSLFPKVNVFVEIARKPQPVLSLHPRSNVAGAIRDYGLGRCGEDTTAMQQGGPRRLAVHEVSIVVDTARNLCS
jgi:hypothetical protein